MRKNILNSEELEKSAALLLDALADILVAGGAPFHSVWEDLRELIESAKLLDPVEIKRHALSLAGKLSEIKDRLAASHKPAPSPNRITTLRFGVEALSQLPSILASLRPGSYFEEVKALEEQLRDKQDLTEFSQDLNDFMLQIREDIWTEKIRVMEGIEAALKKLEGTETNFMDSMAASQDHLEKSEMGFTQTMTHGLEEIDSLIKPQPFDLDDLCHRLSEKVNRLCDQVELKKKADLARLEALDQDRRLMASNLEKTRRDYEEFSAQSHEMLREIENLRAVSLRDSLTGIYNRRAYDRQITATIAAVETGELKTAALVIFDIDHFRNFNNNYGHLAGDRVLTHVARVTAATLRGDDFFFRYGGDEFGIIMPNTTRQNAFIVGEKVRQSIGMVDFKIFKNSDQLANVTVSVGVAEMEKGDDPARLFARADLTLYIAKKGGRNMVVAEPEPVVRGT